MPLNYIILKLKLGLETNQCGGYVWAARVCFDIDEIKAYPSTMVEKRP